MDSDPITVDGISVWNTPPATKDRHSPCRRYVRLGKSCCTSCRCERWYSAKEFQDRYPRSVHPISSPSYRSHRPPCHKRPIPFAPIRTHWSDRDFLQMLSLIHISEPTRRTPI